MDRIPEPEGRSYPERETQSKALKVVGIVAIIIAASLLVIVVYMTQGLVNGVHAPIGTWSAKAIMSPTEVTVDFGTMSSRVEPVDIRLIMVMNDTTEGMYGFHHNEDGALVFLSGTEARTLIYSDLTDNGWIDVGDQIMLSGLSPGSDYELHMIWAPTGDRITSVAFATPTG